MSGFNFGQLQEMLGQARQQYDALRQKMAAIVVEGTAGGGMVTVRMNGEKQVLEVRLDAGVARDDPEMLADLVRAAVNDAGRQVDERLRGELGQITGLPLGGLF
ncbi:MAG TPA: YbaB/EbfC family nucleoid-associated protein [Terriglobales bacterium]|nr:YbaB/EbfC family nucleoid-associated protein [Terriglobales bacterium]